MKEKNYNKQSSFYSVNIYMRATGFSVIAVVYRLNVDRTQESGGNRAYVVYYPQKVKLMMMMIITH